MEPGGWTRSPGTAVLRRAREVRAISQNLAEVLHEWPTTGEILRDFSLNFTPVLTRSRQAAQQKEAEEQRRVAEAKAAAEAEAKAAFEAEAQAAREAAAAAEKEAAAEAERKRLLSLLDTVQSLHEKVDESATALSGIQTGVAEQDKVQLEQERRISELQSRLLESVRLNEQLTHRLNAKEQENRDLRKELDEQKASAAQQIRLGHSEQWAASSKHNEEVAAWKMRNEKLAIELQHTRQQFRSFLRIVQEGRHHDADFSFRSPLIRSSATTPVTP